MTVRIIILLIALIVGGWMIFDGVHVLAAGKYFGPQKPGPWSDLVAFFGINPFKLGIPFITLGVLWLLFSFGVFLKKSWAWYGAVFAAVATLWYAPVGTVLSVIYLALLFVFRSKF